MTAGATRDRTISSWHHVVSSRLRAISSFPRAICCRLRRCQLVGSMACINHLRIRTRGVARERRSTTHDEQDCVQSGATRVRIDQSCVRVDLADTPHRAVTASSRHCAMQLDRSFMQLARVASRANQANSYSPFTSGTATRAHDPARERCFCSCSARTQLSGVSSTLTA